MKNFGVFVAGAAVFLAGACSDEATQPIGNTAAANVTQQMGSPSVAKVNCVAKANEVVGVSGARVSDVTKLEGGYRVLMTVPEAEQPWVCETDRTGNAMTVSYLGEG